MNSAATVDNLINNWKTMGLTKAEMAVKVAEACMGWPYVWGGYGQYDTPSNRKSYAERSSCPAGEKEQIRKKCQVLNGSKNDCSGCKYYPGAKVRFFDCRGFTRWVLQQEGITISGAGATSQWNTNSNWSEKGTISNLPMDRVCCVFMQDGTKMSHTGLHIGGGIVIHCSGEVKRGNTSDRGWSHYAIPVGMEGDVPVPTTKPTVRIGSTGPYVVECQNDLIQLGYDLSPYGADGKYGRTTSARVADFQRASGLKADGICGPMTWGALDEAVGPTPTTKLFTAHIPHLTAEQADALIANYPGAWKTEE